MTVNFIRKSAIMAGMIVLSACATTQSESSTEITQKPKPMMMETDKHEAMKAKHTKKMENMPQECKTMMAKMHEKMKNGDMDMEAMKAKMQSGQSMSEKQNKCHKIMHQNMQNKGEASAENPENGEHKH